MHITFVAIQRSETAEHDVRLTSTLAAQPHSCQVDKDNWCSYASQVSPSVLLTDPDLVTRESRQKEVQYVYDKTGRNSSVR